MNMTFGVLQERFRRSEDVLSSMRRITDQMDSIKNIGAIAAQMDYFSSARMIQEQAKKLAFTGDTYSSLGLSASSGLAKTITQMNSRAASLSSFGPDIDTLEFITDKFNTDSSTIQA